MLNCIGSTVRAVTASILICSLVALAMFAEDQRSKPIPIRPVNIRADNLPRLISSLPQYSPFSLSGLAFLNGRLYVGSNLGIIEIRDGNV